MVWALNYYRKPSLFVILCATKMKLLCTCANNLRMTYRNKEDQFEDDQ